MYLYPEARRVVSKANLKKSDTDFYQGIYSLYGHLKGLRHLPYRPDGYPVSLSLPNVVMSGKAWLKASHDSNMADLKKDQGW